MSGGIEGADAWSLEIDERGRRTLHYDSSLADVCAIDGCREPIEVARRPDGRWRVRHGAAPTEGDVRFYSASELFTTDGYRGFVRELHAAVVTKDEH